MLFPQVELKTQSICDFLNAPLIANRVAGRRNHRRLRPISMVFSNTDRYPVDAQPSDNHVGQSFSGSKFLGLGFLPLGNSRVCARILIPTTLNRQAKFQN
jgi:hypothetical protein